MDNPETIDNSISETSQNQLLPVENNCRPVEKVLLNNDNAEPSNIVDHISNSENQIPVDSTDVSTQNANVTAESGSIVPTNNSMPPLPPLPKTDNGQLPQPPAAQFPADYNMQNYANYNNYMYNYNNYYGYPYPQYQWDYNSQQYYQPYQNYYNYNFNQANQTQTSKPPPPPPDAVQLPVEEKPANKTNAVVDDSNRYSPTAEIDDDDSIKGLSGGLSENYKPDVLIEKPTLTTNAAPFEMVTSEQMEVQQNIPENIDNIIQQTIDPPTLPLITQLQQQVPLIAQVQPYNIQIQQPTYQINSLRQMQSNETVNDLVNQQQTSPAINGKDDSIEKVSKASTVLGKSQAKKRLMAFSMMKQKLQEQNNSVIDNQSSDIGEGNDVEFVPDHNVFQTVSKKKVITNKKVAKVIKAQQTIEQIEEMKKDELLQGNNAALYQHLLRSGGNEAPILQKLGIESLAEKYSAKIREQDKRSSRHHHRRRDESRRGHKYRRRSHSKSRSRSRSTEKPKMRALEVKSWKDFVKGGFHFDRFRRFKMDEAEEIKDKERKSRKKKRHGESRSDSKNHKNESNILSEPEKGTGDQKLRYNLLDRKKEILKGLEVNTHEGDFTKDFPSYIIRCTKNKPSIKFSENPANATYHLQNRQQMFATLLPEIEAIVLKFLSAMKPKKLKENCSTENNYNNIDEKLLVMMKDRNIYPFKGWWPKTNFIITQVKEDPNVEIDEAVLMNEITTSKRTKKSRFNDDTSLVELRPTVPSKWDSDYDGSPAAENKVVYVGVTQSLEMNINDNVCTIKREENNSLDTSHQEEEMDTASDVGEEEPKIEVNVCPALPDQIQEPQMHAKLNTEYEEFLKIVKVDKEENDISITTATNITTQNDNENNLSMKSVSLNDESIQDESDEYMSTKSSEESVSLQNAAEETDSNDRSFIEELSTIDLKYRKKKKKSGKKSKTFKNKESKKKKHKSSSSESSQDSESESYSSSDDSDSESTDSTSTVEKRKKNKSKNKKKRKTKTNYKKKHRGDKNKTKSPEDKKDANSSILNLIEKALNVEIKKRPSDSKESKQKKKKRKHEKKESKSSEENDEKFEKVKDCLKETITKLVKTEKVNKNQSLSCDDTVIEVLKYLNNKEKKNKKSKKSLKRKHDSDISDDEGTPKKSKLVDSYSKHKVNDKKKKNKKKKSVERKSVDSDEHMTKKKSKKKSKTTDTSEAEEVEVNQNKSKIDSVQFFELRPNEWNIIKKSSRRGVVHHSEVKNKNKTSPVHDTRKHNENVKQNKSDSLNLIDKCPSNRSKSICEIPKLLDKEDVEIERQKQLLKPNKNIKKDNTHSVSKSIVDEKKNLMNFKNSDSKPNEEEEKCIEENYEISNKSADKCLNNIFKLNNDLQQTVFLKNDNSEQLNTNKDLKSNFKPQTQSTPPIDLYDKSPIICTIAKTIPETISYRDKVKMNLKKLSSYQNIPFVFGFSSPISLIKSNNIKFDKNKDFKVTKEEKSIEDEPKVGDPKVDETQLLESDKPKVINFPQTQMEIPDVTEKELLKVNIETNDKTLDHSCDWDNSEESDTDHSLITSANTSEHSSDERESEQVNSNLLKNDSPNISNKNETFSNNSESKELDELISNEFETNSSSESVIKEQQELPLEVNNFLIKEEINTLSNITDFSEQHLDCNTENLQNNVISVNKDKQDSKPVYCQNPGIDIIEVSKSNNELITQWTSDWINLDKSVTEINHSSNFKFGDEELQLKKKSRWDKQPMDNNIRNSQWFINRQKDDKDESETNNLTDELKYTNSPSNNKISLYNDQNQTSEIMSINCLNDYHEINPYVYDDYSQTYEQYSGIPTYSEMKTIDHALLSPVDYSVYENFNPNYNYHTEDYEMWKSEDTSEQEMLKAIPTTDETLINVFEILPTDNTSVNQVEFLQEELPNENIDTIISDAQEEIIKNEKSDSASRDEQFVKLYHQHFQHYNQNPIKYSLSDPVIFNADDVKVNIPDILTSQEKLPETDEKSDDIISIPLQTRAYVCIFEDDNTNLYLTSDNYMAYCAIEDKCMVHISINTCSRDGVGEDVRHCFNVSLSGTINEYWLHADLIPFYAPSDAESGVFSSDEVDSLDSDYGHEEDVDNDNNENDDHIIESEWELVDNIYDNVNSWLDEPYILKKYNIEHDVSHINQEQEHNATSSSECDSDGSDFSDSYVELFNEKQNVIDVVTPINVSKNTENSDLLLKTEECMNSSEQLDLDVGIKNEIDTLEIVTENNLTSKINLDNNDVLRDFVDKVNNDNITVKSEVKENTSGNESGICMKEEVTVADLSMINTIINQKILIQKLKVCAKEKIHEKLPDTIMVHYSDNMETIKHPFLGLFQPPTNSILSKPRSTKPTHTSKLSKRVTFADGIRPGDNLAASPTHDDVGCPLSPPPLKRLMRETLKFKRNMYPLKKTRVRTKVTMVKRKVAKVTPSIKETNPSIIEYYISRHRLADLPIGEIPNSSFSSTDHSSTSNNERTEKISTPPRPTREVTPVPSDTEGWNDDDINKNKRLK